MCKSQYQACYSPHTTLAACQLCLMHLGGHEPQPNHDLDPNLDQRFQAGPNTHSHTNPCSKVTSCREAINQQSARLGSLCAHTCTTDGVCPVSWLCPRLHG